MIRARAGVPCRRLVRIAPRRALSYSALDKTIHTRPVGKPNTKEWQLHFYESSAKDAKQLSPWHDISLLPVDMPVGTHQKDIVNMIVEMPKGTNAKLEISKDVKGNPIVQDVKDGALRYLKHGNLPWNYGAFPQTWEAPDLRLFGQHGKGDEDPVDVVELGSAERQIGDVLKVRVLGAFCLLDQGEADWKVVAIGLDDPLAESLHNIRDVEMHLPGKLEEIREWYRVYKVAEGKKENSYAFDGECLPKSNAVDLLGHTHFAWLKYRHMRPELIPRLPGFQ